MGCSMQWNHFGSCHGKGHQDGAGVHVKQALRVEQIQFNSTQLQDAKDVVSSLKRYFGLQHLAYDNARRDVLGYFYEMKVTNVNRVDQFNVQTMEGTHGFHQVIKNVGLDKIPFHVRTLYCFYKFYSNSGDGPCKQCLHLRPSFCT